MVLSMLLFLQVSVHAAHWDHGNLEASPNGRYLMNEDGTPFFWFGDTAWALTYKIDAVEAETYFADREAKGFTVVQAAATSLGATTWISAQNIVNGEIIFNNQDPLQPNEAFWQHVDTLVQTAEQHNIYIGLLPTWGEFVCPNAREPGPKIFNENNAYQYGQWIGNRYRDSPNIIWINGGDRRGDECDSTDIPIWQALGNGIKSVDSNHIMTYHTSRGSGSFTLFHNDNWLDLNMIQTGSYLDDVIPLMSEGYNRNPVKPVIQSEPGYAGYDVTGKEYRSQPYRTILSGGAGHTRGHRYLWSMYHYGEENVLAYGTFPGTTSWNDYLDTAETTWDVNAKDFFQSIEWWSLIPDQNLITAGENSGDYQKVAAFNSDMIVVYYPTQSSATIDTSRLSSSVTARWWDPFDKSEVNAGTHSGALTLTPPWEDAVLIIVPEMIIPITRELVLDLTMDDVTSGQVNDGSGKNNHATINGAQIVSGRVGNAMEFDGDDYLSVPYSDSLRFLNEITVSAWVNKQQDLDGWRVLVFKEIGTLTSEHFFLGMNDNAYRWFVSTGAYSDTDQGPIANIDEWIHLTGTYDGQNVKLYVNGAEFFTNAHSGSFLNDNNPLLIGAGTNDQTSFIEHFTGKIDELKIFNYALTASEVQSLYNSCSMSEVINTINLWKNNQASITDVMQEINNWKNNC